MLGDIYSAPIDGAGSLDMDHEIGSLATLNKIARGKNSLVPLPVFLCFTLLDFQAEYFLAIKRL